jgi:hypothetical protein
MDSRGSLAAVRVGQGSRATPAPPRDHLTMTRTVPGWPRPAREDHMMPVQLRTDCYRSTTATPDRGRRCSEGVRMSTSEDGESLGGCKLLFHLPLSPLRWGRQLFECCLVSGEHFTELGLRHGNAGEVKVCAANVDVLHPVRARPCKLEDGRSEARSNKSGEHRSCDRGRDQHLCRIHTAEATARHCHWLLPSARRPGARRRWVMRHQA